MSASCTGRYGYTYIAPVTSLLESQRLQPVCDQSLDLHESSVASSAWCIAHQLLAVAYSLSPITERLRPVAHSVCPNCSPWPRCAFKGMSSEMRSLMFLGTPAMGARGCWHKAVPCGRANLVTMIYAWSVHEVVTGLCDTDITLQSLWCCSINHLAHNEMCSTYVASTVGSGLLMPLPARC